jgi:DNA-directed RNA polymerase subunit RPC12/RpoP
MQKCQRCGTNVKEPVKGWSTCPKCGLGVFLGKVKKTTTKNEEPKPEDESGLVEAAKSEGKIE